MEPSRPRATRERRAHERAPSERLLNVADDAPVVVLVGGLDTRAAAGLLADLRAVQDTGVFAVTVPSALTVQPKRSPTVWQATSPKLFAAALQAIFTDHTVAAVKVGMLANASQARALLQALPAGVPLVWDPVLATSKGTALYRGSIAALAPLAARATLVTPNTMEAEHLLDLRVAAILLKGGHKAGPEVIDTLMTETTRREFRKPRLDYDVRGTGCALAARITAELALGHSLTRAVTNAELWLDDKYRSAAARQKSTRRTPKSS